MNKPVARLTILIVFSASLCLAQPEFSEHIIAGDYNSPWWVQGVDLDVDGDIDAVATSFYGGRLDWWENDGNQNFTMHSISSTVPGAMACQVIDLDQDSDMDIVIALNSGACIGWLENIGELQFQRRNIASWPGANLAKAADIDSDGDLDIMATACEYNTSRIGWFENDGAEDFTPHIFHDDWTRANHICAGDLDGDDDMDLMGTASISSIICVFENDGESNFTDNIISQNWGRPSCIYADDLDGDDDLDLLTTVCEVNRIGWWENDGDGNLSYIEIDSDFRRPHLVRTADFDNDGDVDVIGIAIDGDEISWWENDGLQNFTKHIVIDNFDGATGLSIIDVDQDGDVDILGSAQYGNEIAWFENMLYNYRFEGSPTTGHAPLEVEFEDTSLPAQPITGRLWDFDDDGQIDSYEQHPTYTFDESGEYTVKLGIVCDADTHTVIYENYVQVFDGYSALQFDGMESYALCEADPTLNITDAFTIEGWIYPDGWGENTSIGLGKIIDKANIGIFICRAGGTLNDSCLVIFHNDSESTSGFSYSPDLSIRLNSWQHIAVTYNLSDGMLLYINGSPRTLSQINPPVGGINDNLYENLYIGNAEGLAETFDGLIDELRIWDHARSGTEIQSSINVTLEGNEPGLVAYWPMEEGNGDIIHDHSDNGNDASLYSTSWTLGKVLNQTSVPESDNDLLPEKSMITCAYPNPFNESAIIKYNLPRSTDVKLDVYDILGRKISSLVDNSQPAGEHQVTWQANGIPSGVYFYKLETDKYSESRKMVLLK